MTDDKYREVLRHAKAELEETRSDLAKIGKEQSRLDQRSKELLEFIVATSKLLGEEYVDEEELGLTDAVRQVYRTASLPLSPVGVEKQLVKTGYDLSKYGSAASATASIHKVVSRLAVKKEITPAGKNSEGRTMYKWQEAAADPLGGLAFLAGGVSKKKQ